MVICYDTVVAFADELGQRRGHPGVARIVVFGFFLKYKLNVLNNFVL